MGEKNVNTGWKTRFIVGDYRKPACDMHWTTFDMHVWY